jgi:hypothetical protein
MLLSEDLRSSARLLIRLRCEHQVHYDLSNSTSVLWNENDMETYDKQEFEDSVVCGTVIDILSYLTSYLSKSCFGMDAKY